jgi:2-dehydropantoate 2-reductase
MTGSGPGSGGGAVRFVVYGAGAVGSVLGARLHQHGHGVVLISRGAHFETIRDHGLRLQCPEETVTVNVTVIDHPARLALGRDDIVLLTMKTQDTLPALRTLAASAPPEIGIFCVQNGVENERLALRLFPNVYGVSVMCPTAYLDPGVVQAYSAPVTGILDVGRYPGGTDEVAQAVSAAFRESTFESEIRDDILRWKHGKLLSNLGNAIEVVCGPPARKGPIDDLAKQEGIACLRAAGIDFAADDDAPRRELVKPREIGAQSRPGGSSWQSAQRGVGTVETDYLNGEIVRLGRFHGVPTPVNELLQRLANRIARERRPPGLMLEEEFLVAVGVETEPADGPPAASETPTRS